MQQTYMHLLCDERKVPLVERTLELHNQSTRTPQEKERMALILGK